MDPQVRAFLAAANASPQPPIDTIPIGTARRQFAALTPLLHPFIAVESVCAAATSGGVPLRVYRSTAAADRLLPGIVYLHGGGWALGSLETHDTLCRHLAHASGAVVVAVDYRLAPEHPYPAAFDDAWDAFQHVAGNGASLGIDPSRLAVAGDSAGGNLAAAVALRARDAGGPAIACQCLLYPVIDHACDTDSYRRFATGFGLTAARMRFFWNAYLAGADGRAPFASPARAENLIGLPPALIVTAEYDVLRDEGETYARGLRAAGVRTEYECVAGMIHGFVHYAGAIHHGQVVLEKLGHRLADELSAGRA